MSNDCSTTRREVFQKGLLIAAGAVAASAALAVPAQAKVSQRASMYQDKPHAGLTCAKCARFVPGKGETDAGSCLVVDGSISPQGWCAMYVPKA
ncbi:MAG: high-potential iron-sulfur protein [Alphaproteobacteria bacterium]|nr:high-potential iron-sulfur protein [Alphaproteobacteria bacterium]